MQVLKCHTRASSTSVRPQIVFFLWKFSGGDHRSLAQGLSRPRTVESLSLVRHVVLAWPATIQNAYNADMVNSTPEQNPSDDPTDISGVYGDHSPTTAKESL
jgi:hypothetical protein